MKAVLYLAIFSIILFSCQKQHEYHPSLPDETTSGKNTFGFLYNGSQVWTSVTTTYNTFSDQPHYTPFAQMVVQTEQDSSKIFYITGSMYIKRSDGTVIANSNVSIELHHAQFSPATYSFDTSTRNRFVFINSLPAKQYNNFNNKFTLTVTYIDQVQQIISGILSGTLYNFNNGYHLDDILQVQDGRFDIRYI